MTISLGTRRSLQQCAQPDGTFAMLAMDQRGSLFRAMNPDHPDAVPYVDVIAIKRDVIGVLSPLASAVLLDVKYGYGACVASGSLAGHSGLLLAQEKTGYEGEPTAAADDPDGRSGASSARSRPGPTASNCSSITGPMRPTPPTKRRSSPRSRPNVAALELPLFVEPLHYSLDRAVKTVPNAERRRIVVETARKLVPLGVTDPQGGIPGRCQADAGPGRMGRCVRRTERRLPRALGAVERGRGLRHLSAPGQSRLRQRGQRRPLRPRRVERRRCRCPNRTGCTSSRPPPPTASDNYPKW